jgi:hypothetical protein
MGRASPYPGRRAGPGPASSPPRRLFKYPQPGLAALRCAVRDVPRSRRHPRVHRGLPAYRRLRRPPRPQHHRRRGVLLRAELGTAGGRRGRRVPRGGDRRPAARRPPATAGPVCPADVAGDGTGQGRGRNSAAKDPGRAGCRRRRVRGLGAGSPLRPAAPHRGRLARHHCAVIVLGSSTSMAPASMACATSRAPSATERDGTNPSLSLILAKSIRCDLSSSPG